MHGRLNSSILFAATFVFASHCQGALTLSAVSTVRDPFAGATTEELASGPQPVSSNVEISSGGSTATATAETGFNSTHVRSTVSASSPSSSPLSSDAVSGLEDGLSFFRNGQSLNTGALDISVQIRGMLDYQPPSTTTGQRMFYFLTVGIGHSTINVTSVGTYDQVFNIHLANPFPGTVGTLPLNIFMAAQTRIDTGVVSAVSDFSARIERITYLRPDGSPDPTVVITSESGHIYGIPEPSSCLMAAMQLLWFILPRRR